VQEIIIKIGLTNNRRKFFRQARKNMPNAYFKNFKESTTAQSCYSTCCFCACFLLPTDALCIFIGRQLLRPGILSRLTGSLDEMPWPENFWLNVFNRDGGVKPAITARVNRHYIILIVFLSSSCTAFSEVFRRRAILRRFSKDHDIGTFSGRRRKGRVSGLHFHTSRIPVHAFNMHWGGLRARSQDANARGRSAIRSASEGYGEDGREPSAQPARRCGVGWNYAGKSAASEPPRLLAEQPHPPLQPVERQREHAPAHQVVDQRRRLAVLPGVLGLGVEPDRVRPGVGQPAQPGGARLGVVALLHSALPQGCRIS
jgi:hypothetical protein